MNHTILSPKRKYTTEQIENLHNGVELVDATNEEVKIIADRNIVSFSMTIETDPRVLETDPTWIPRDPNGKDP